MNKTDLRKLVMRSCQIGDAGLVALAQALENNKFTRLEELCLNQNDFTALGVSALAKAVRNNPRCVLQKLHLARSSLKNDSTEFLCQIFGTLLKLDIEYNEIVSDGAKSVAVGLAEWGSELRLEELHLSGNHLGDEGSVALARAMGSCAPSLSHVGLSSCSIRDEGAKELAVHVIGNRACSIRNLDLEANLFLQEGVQAVYDSLKETELVGLEVHGQWEDVVWEGEDEDAEALTELLDHVNDEFQRIKSLRPLYVLLSPRLLDPRNGSKSALRKLPSDLIRKVAALFYE
jgi:Ran GTPase-activating protein (RanGAP) involved in mRNA processing and transport